ncbi:MAG: hypothetical protein GY830_06855 [Bacteroidetes bacterium]|nr:hypothetical protein [Bacteroidota bacterium]
MLFLKNSTYITYLILLILNIKCNRETQLNLDKENDQPKLGNSLNSQKNNNIKLKNNIISRINKLKAKLNKNNRNFRLTNINNDDIKKADIDIDIKVNKTKKDRNSQKKDILIKSLINESGQNKIKIKIICKNKKVKPPNLSITNKKIIKVGTKKENRKIKIICRNSDKTKSGKNNELCGNKSCKIKNKKCRNIKICHKQNKPKTEKKKEKKKKWHEKFTTIFKKKKKEKNNINNDYIMLKTEKGDKVYFPKNQISHNKQFKMGLATLGGFVLFAAGFTVALMGIPVLGAFFTFGGLIILFSRNACETHMNNKCRKKAQKLLEQRNKGMVIKNKETKKNKKFNFKNLFS